MSNLLKYKPKNINQIKFTINKLIKIFSINSVTKYRAEIVLIILLLLGFETPGKLPSIDYFLQLYTIAVAGIFSWIYLLTKDRKKLIYYLKNYLVIIILISLSLLAIFHHDRTNLIGSYLFPNSILSTLCLLGSGMLISGTNFRKRISIIYGMISLITYYSLISFSSYYFNSRFYGNFLQPDIFAEFITVAFIAGLEIINNINNKKIKILIYLNQLFLIAILYLTKTRAVFLLAIVINLLYIVLVDMRKRKYIQTSFLVILVGLFFLSPFRSTSPSSLSYSSTYRFHLQEVAIHHVKGSLIVGAGNDGLQNSILCGDFYKHKELLRTCEEGYYFTSTHNIFLDKIMVFGLLGSLSLIIVILYRIFRNSISTNNYSKAAGLMLLSVFFYYFTNVTSLTIEAILFALLF